MTSPEEDPTARLDQAAFAGPSHRFPPAGGPELGVDVLGVAAQRVERDEQLGGDVRSASSESSNRTTASSRRSRAQTTRGSGVRPRGRGQPPGDLSREPWPQGSARGPTAAAPGCQSPGLLLSSQRPHGWTFVQEETCIAVGFGNRPQRPRQDLQGPRSLPQRVLGERLEHPDLQGTSVPSPCFRGREQPVQQGDDVLESVRGGGSRVDVRPAVDGLAFFAVLGQAQAHEGQVFELAEVGLTSSVMDRACSRAQATAWRICPWAIQRRARRAVIGRTFG